VAQAAAQCECGGGSCVVGNIDHGVPLELCGDSAQQYFCKQPPGPLVEI
jgi:hypothetical protein